MNEVRIVKVDARNYCVQQFRELENKKAGTTRTDWVDAGYYGDKLEWAVNSALMVKVPEGKSLLGEFKKAAADIIAAMGENS